MRKILFFVLLMLATTIQAQQKREFRGAWIQCVNGQFKGMGTERMQKTLTYQLDELKKDGCNVIIFQVRPECDALLQKNPEYTTVFRSGSIFRKTRLHCTES